MKTLTHPAIGEGASTKGRCGRYFGEVVLQPTRATASGQERNENWQQIRVKSIMVVKEILFRISKADVKNSWILIYDAVFENQIQRDSGCAL